MKVTPIPFFIAHQSLSLLLLLLFLAIVVFLLCDTFCLFFKVEVKEKTLSLLGTMTWMARIGPVNTAETILLQTGQPCVVALLDKQQRRREPLLKRSSPTFFASHYYHFQYESTLGVLFHINWGSGPINLNWLWLQEPTIGNVYHTQWRGASENRTKWQTAKKRLIEWEKCRFHSTALKV